MIYKPPYQIYQKKNRYRTILPHKHSRVKLAINNHLYTK